MKNIYKYFIGIVLFAFAFMLMPQTALADEDQKAASVLVDEPEPTPVQAEPGAPDGIMNCPPGYSFTTITLVCMSYPACIPSPISLDDLEDYLRQENYKRCGVIYP